MATVAESVSALQQLRPDLRALRVLSLDQNIIFAQYIKYVLPLDGYVFWLKTQQIPAQGSLHYTTDKRQLEDETIAVNRVLFSTGEPIQPLNEVGPELIWVGQSGGIKFAFSSRQSFYEAAGMHHYVGDAVYPAMETQLIDLGAELSDRTLIVSNSLPVWLALRNYDPDWLFLGNPGITFYPSFAVPDNLRPPYGSVHIEPSQTRALQAFPTIGPTGSHSQLAADRVRLTLYGATNSVALQVLDLVNQYSSDTDVIGMMGPALVRDEKRTQTELAILAMKKTIEFEVSYNQASVAAVARALISHAAAQFNPIH